MKSEVFFCIVKRYGCRAGGEGSEERKGIDVGRGFTPAVNPPSPVKPPPSVILSEAKNLTYIGGSKPPPYILKYWFALRSFAALEDDTFGVGRKTAFTHTAKCSKITEPPLCKGRWHGLP